MTTDGKKPWVRGVVWIAIGAAVYVGGLAFNTPIVVRGTSVPWGLVVIGLGVVLLIWDSLKARKKE